MKIPLHIFSTCVFVWLALNTRGQGAFLNLDFQTVHYVGGNGLYDYYLPWWNAIVGSNFVALDSQAISVIDRNLPDYNGGAPSGLIHGKYCLSLQYGVISHDQGVFIYAPVGISQTGQIPTDAQSLIFNGINTAYPPLVVSFNGTQIPLLVLNDMTTYNVWAGDISQFAGQTGVLNFISYLHFNYLDNIQFSASSIPEPNATDLSALGILAFGWRFIFRLRTPKPRERL